MAAILSAIVGDAVSRAISLLGRHFSHERSTEAKLQKIRQMLIRIHSVVEEAKGRQIQNHGTLQWLMELIDCEYLGLYLLDTIPRSGEVEREHEVEEEEKEEHVQLVPVPPHALSSSLLRPAKRMRVAAACAFKRVLLLPRRNFFPQDLEIDGVLENLQVASAGLREFILLLQGYQRIHRALVTNIFVDGQMFGRHVEKEMVVNFLLHDGGRCSKAGFISVLPIVGAPGVGKTTLVQHACDDFRVRRHFPTIIFFSFSICSNRNGCRAIQHSKHINGSVTIDVSDPLEFIRDNFISNKKLLMVIEDVDMHKNQLLEQFLQSQLGLGCAKTGSKMIVTANNQRAVSIGTVEPLRLKFLPYPEYWFFFKAHAFAGRDVEEVQSLVAAGKAISRKINRSFFGAKIIGGLLRNHPDPKFWCKVLRSNIGGLSLVGDGVNYVADLAKNLWLNRVNLDLVTISKNPVDGQAELAKFEDLCELLHGSVATHLAQDVRSVNILMCKSVMPFYSQCYVASCTVDLTTIVRIVCRHCRLSEGSLL